MPQPDRTDAERYGHITIHDGVFLCNVFRDAAGIFYTDHRDRRLRFRRSIDLRFLIRQMYCCRDLPVLVIDRSSPRGAPSPVLTEDLQPPPPPYDRRPPRSISTCALVLCFRRDADFYEILDDCLLVVALCGGGGLVGWGPGSVWMQRKGFFYLVPFGIQDKRTLIDAFIWISVELML
jgi:hypothetical protein